MNKNRKPTILAVETSADETAAAVIRGTEILSSVKWSQQVHGQWGGIVPALAKRDHELRIEAIINQAMKDSGIRNQDSIDAIAVTVGPGLAIALEVGIKWAKKLAQEWDKPLIAVNHIEGHLLSAIAMPNRSIPNAKSITFPCLGLVVSGGHTQLILVEKIGKYKILVESVDDNIGEALDKGARMLGIPYPGGPTLEKMAAQGDPKKYKLPLPMAGKEGRAFSYSGLKTAFRRLVLSTQCSVLNGEPDEQVRNDLAAGFQEMVFRHLLRTIKAALKTSPLIPLLSLGEGNEGRGISNLLVGGGVIANKTLRNKLDELGKELNLKVHYPENMMLCTDNAAMIGVVAGYKYGRGEFATEEELERKPRWRIDEPVVK